MMRSSSIHRMDGFSIKPITYGNCVVPVFLTTPKFSPKIIALFMKDRFRHKVLSRIINYIESIYSSILIFHKYEGFYWLQKSKLRYADKENVISSNLFLRKATENICNFSNYKNYSFTNNLMLLIQIITIYIIKNQNPGYGGFKK